MFGNKESRVPKMELIERIIFKGRSCFTNAEDPKTVQLMSHIEELDREWFGNMPDTFFIAKYHEEMGELIAAHENYVSTKYRNRSEEERKSLRYAFIGELSDVILASSSALHQHKINEDEVIGTISDLMTGLDETAKRYGSGIRIDKLDISDLLDAHASKMDEMIFAKNTYLKITWDEPTPWKNMLLKLHTYDELADPRNKMTIVKEIRRMWFALKEFGITN